MKNSKNSTKKGENSKQSGDLLATSSELSNFRSKYSQKQEKDTNLWNAKDAVAYAEKKIGVKLDEWQRLYINTKGNTAVRAGRQSGKSFAESLRVALFALQNPNTQTLIIGAVDRQSVELFEKVKAHLIILAKNNIKGRPTMHKIALSNGSKIIALPCGRTGYGLRNYAIHKLVVDEAHYVPEEVFVAVRPMLATTGGTIDLLSTPRGNKGFFHDCFSDDEFTTFHVLSKDCPRITEDFLKSEQKRMTKLQFSQEYEAEFLDQLQQFFSKDLIDSCIIPQSSTPEVGRVCSPVSTGGYFLGVDFAGYGGDENAFVTLSNGKKVSFVSQYETSEKVSAWETVNTIIRLNEQLNYKKIGVDDGGLGTPILDFLLEHNKLRRKVIGLNNAKRNIDKDGKVKTLMKNDMYGNLKMMMEQGLIKIPDSEDIIRSLLSIQIEINEETKKEIIFGKYSHITEALIRAAWLVKSKGLNIMAFC